MKTKNIPHLELYRNPSLVNTPSQQFSLCFMRAVEKIFSVPQDEVPAGDEYVNFCNEMVAKFTDPVKGLSKRERMDLTKRHLDHLEYSMKDKSNARQMGKSVAMLLDYRIGDNPIYKTNIDFFKAISRTEVDLDVVSLPIGKRFYIHLPQPVRFIGEDVTGAYVYFNGDGDLQGCTLTIVSSATDEESVSFGGIIATLNLPLNNNSVKESYLHGMEVADKGVQKDMSLGFTAIEVVQGFINCCIYIESLNPDITHLAPAKDKKVREATAKKYSVSTEEISLNYPVKLLNWSYGKDRVYSVFNTWRDSHLRWQRCGPNRSQVKLIVVEGHNMTFKNAMSKVIGVGQ